MAIRIVSRLILLLVVLAAATALMVGVGSLLASIAPDGAISLVERDQVTAVKRAVEDPADDTADASPTPAVALVFAGIVLVAALPPVHRIHVYDRSSSFDLL